MEFTPLTIGVGILLAISAVFDYAYFTYYLQLKEYRFDRMRDFLSTEEGRAVLREYRMLWRTLFIAVMYTLLNGVVAATWILLIILCTDLVSKAYHVIKKAIRRPVPTKKALIIVGCALGVELLLFIIFPLINIVLLLIVFRWVLVIGIALALYYPSQLAKHLYILKATKKMSNLKDLKVVGITGSYGKSSTKEFLSQILTHSYTVIKTPRNINTEIGIAKHILSTDFSKADIFVVEMGAYRIGEIQAICNIVHPTIGILTAIAPQHLSLFGSMKNIQQAKYELLRALPENGFAVTNVDNKYCRELLQSLRVPIRTFGSDDEYNPDVLIKEVKNTTEGIAFSVSWDGQFRDATLPVFGKHNVFNIIPAAIVAKHIGMSRDDIDAAIENIQPGQGMIRTCTYGNTIILNDSYNSNPEGFKAALDVLNSYPSEKKRIVITRGMLELGEKSDEIHEQVGGEISFVADELVIISRNAAESLSAGVVGKYNTKICYMYDHATLLEYLKGIKDTNAVVLLESRMPSFVYSELEITQSS